MKTLNELVYTGLLGFTGILTFTFVIVLIANHWVLVFGVMLSLMTGVAIRGMKGDWD